MSTVGPERERDGEQNVMLGTELECTSCDFSILGKHAPQHTQKHTASLNTHFIPERLHCVRVLTA